MCSDYTHTYLNVDILLVVHTGCRGCKVEVDGSVVILVLLDQHLTQPLGPAQEGGGEGLVREVRHDRALALLALTTDTDWGEVR